MNKNSGHNSNMSPEAASKILGNIVEREKREAKQKKFNEIAQKISHYIDIINNNHTSPESKETAKKNIKILRNNICKNKEDIDLLISLVKEFQKQHNSER